MDRSISVDVLKLILSFFVVGIHLNFFKEFSDDVYYILTQGVFRIAVPVFLIINGYFFERVQDIKQLRRWLFRILFLYTFWMLFYVPFWSSNNFTSILFTFLKGYFHLWYIIGIVYAALILYIIKNLDYIYLNIIAFTLYLFGASLQYLHCYDLIRIPNYIYRNFLFFCLPFFIFGFVIRKMEIKKKVVNINLYLYLSILFFLFEVYYNINYSIRSIPFDMLQSFSILCPLLFLKVKQIDVNSNIRYISLISSCVYFVHPVVYFLIKCKYEFNSIIFFCFTILISFLISIPLILLNNKIKIL